MTRSLVAAAVAVLIAGCGGEGDKEAARAVEDAVAKTASQPLDFDQTVTIEAGPEERIDLALSGIADGRERRLRARIEADWHGRAEPKGDARIFAGLTGEMAVDGERIYMQVEILDRELDLDGRWLLADPSDPAARAAGFSGSSSLGTLDSTRPVDHLRAADSVKRVGEDDGSTRYRMTIDYTRYQDLIEEKRRKALAPELEKLKQATRTDRHPLDAWIDADGRINRIQGRIRTVLGRDLIKYKIDMRPTDAAPAIPREAVTFRDLRAR